MSSRDEVEIAPRWNNAKAQRDIILSNTTLDDLQASLFYIITLSHHRKLDWLSAAGREALIVTKAAEGLLTIKAALEGSSSRGLTLPTPPPSLHRAMRQAPLETNVSSMSVEAHFLGKSGGKGLSDHIALIS